MKTCKALHRGRFGPESDLHCDLENHDNGSHLDSLEDIWWEENNAAEPVALLRPDPVKVLKEAA
jgi:hypothetical protein